MSCYLSLARFAGFTGFVIGTPGLAATQAVVTGLVRDSAGSALSQVEVVVVAAQARSLTDSAGRYVLRLPFGLHQVRFRRVGLVPASYRVTIFDSSEVRLDVTLSPSPQALPEVSVRAHRMSWNGFEERRAEGFGHFLTDSVLRRSEARRLSDLIRSRVPGVRFVRTARRTIAMGVRSSCPMAIWVDGLRLYAPDASTAGPFTKRLPTSVTGLGTNPPPDLNQWSVTEIQAVEVYNGPASTPAEFQLTGSACGTILVWTRQR